MTGHDDAMDLVRRTLEEARDAARTQGKDVGRGRRRPAVRRVAGASGRRGWSGPGPDSRDPQPLGTAARDVAKKHGWSSRVAEGTVFGQWPSVVGQQIAEHAVPTALRAGVLGVSAESTAWATQLRIIQAQVLAKIAAAVGDGVVTSLKITGPVAPSWRKGPLHIAGRGPRDTYG
jgi:predicted nucleic acid-binding Zn ribbon protein